ncbi:putative nuclease HARBI1 [Cucumis melo var. makuwa]|uniref:Putative nuclease HARBI1 n=1 Tax=Cucumis melo var. makuwa TaxID=1194695 RepID=A0A5D3BSR4_CUCMM|nr:putative nuclease HARBI1 [Cucumis melo var. makuwa]
MVAMFLHVLAYIVKNRIIQREFVQSELLWDLLWDIGQDVYKGWKGSVADLHILRDALSRPNGLGQRYHLQEWRDTENASTIVKEYFNMKHSFARNVIEHAFYLLKGCWAILRGKSYYSVEVHYRTNLAVAYCTI